MYCNKTWEVGEKGSFLDFNIKVHIHYSTAQTGPDIAANGVAALAVPGCQVLSRWCMGARARVVRVRGALGPCRCVVWRSSVLGARCGRGLPVKEPGLIALWQGDQRCGRSVGSWMACGGRQGWSGTRVLGINRGSRHSTFSGRAHWSKVSQSVFKLD